MRTPAWVLGYRMHKWAASTKVLLTAALLWLAGVSVLLHPMLNQLGQIHGLQHASALVSDTDHRHAHAPEEGDDREDQQGIHGLFHHADACSLAAITPHFPYALTVPLEHGYAPAVMVLPLANRLTDSLRPPIALA